MKLFKNGDFEEKAALPLTVKVPENIHLGIQIEDSELHQTDYKTVIEACWATPR